jgi:integrase
MKGSHIAARSPEKGKSVTSIEECMKLGRRVNEITDSDLTLVEQGKRIQAMFASLNKEDVLRLLQPLLGEKLEKEALAKYRHNADWAIRGILHDSQQEADTASYWESLKEKYRSEIAQELTPQQFEQFPIEEVLDRLPGILEQYIMDMVRQWRDDPRNFDPLEHFHKRLVVQGRSEGTIKEYYALAARFVGQFGRKRSYTNEEIVEFLFSLRKYMGENSYKTRVAYLRSFISAIEPKREFPIKTTKFTGETHAPALSTDEVDALILNGCIWLDDIELLRLAVMTIYGARVSEVARLSYTNIDLPSKTLTIPLSKRERARPQPIPEFMLNVFSAPVQPCLPDKLQRHLKRWARLAGFLMKRRGGVHSIRRSVATELHGAGVHSLDLYHFMRWQTSHAFGMLPSYIKTPHEVTDLKVLELHPYVETWKIALMYRPNSQNTVFQWPHLR